MSKFYTEDNNQIRKLWTFSGGIHIPDNKAQSLTRPAGKAEMPQRLVIPLQQHIGAPNEPLVAVGDKVLKGQMIGQSQGFVSAPVHASTSGTVVDIGDHPVAHPSALPGPCIVIEPDKEDKWADLPPPMEYYATWDKRDIRNRIRESGIVGMGGASFPTSVKLSPPEGQQDIQSLIINGAECEPFITSDDVLMQNHAERIINGAAIMNYLLDAKECLIAIEDNKPEAIEVMKKAVAATEKLDNAHVVVIPTLYPSGSEKQLIYILTGKEVPQGGLPSQVGVVVQNVSTAAAVSDAVLEGKPLISRLVTLTGEGIKEPQNLEVLLGTQVEELVPQVGGYTNQASKLIMGGPMMGFSMRSDAIPVGKANNCVLVPSLDEIPNPENISACIRCLRCVDACPMGLVPQNMYWHVQSKALDKAKENNLFDCVECGCCSHVCPSRIPLVQFFRSAKAANLQLDRDQQKKERARERAEARNERLEKIAAEKKAKMEAKKAAMKKKKEAAAALKKEQEEQAAAKPAADTNEESTGSEGQDG
ncbi:MAG: electron transport complex subunit RsxC [Gammaproteobacteria bacterium]|nr:electron transport complex subunit RsxC [Gammaproteobacteria bacterium]